MIYVQYHDVMSLKLYYLGNTYGFIHNIWGNGNGLLYVAAYRWGNKTETETEEVEEENLSGTSQPDVAGNRKVSNLQKKIYILTYLYLV